MKCIHETEYGICEIDNDLCHNGLCRIKEPQTNADRIRSMSDEELADFLETVNMCECGFAMGVSPCRKAGTDGCPCWLDWLKSPVEVDE